MNEVMVKEINFEGANLLATEKDGKIYVGVKWICNGIGLTQDQSKRQVKNLKDDFVLTRGVSNLTLPTNGGNQESLCIELDYLPLWLSKISITPNMIETNSLAVENLVTYQLKVKDVLANAFIKNQFKAPTTLKEALLLALEQQEKIEQLELESKIKDEKLVEQAPKVEFADKILKSKANVLVGDFAKVLCDEGFNIGEGRLFSWLRTNKILYKENGSNKPYQYYMDRGYFTCKETVVNTAFRDIISVTTLISPKGQVWLYNKLKEEKQFKK